MSYDSECLTDLPEFLLQGRDGPATNGDMITDLSPNGKDFQLYYHDASAFLTPYGRPTAIETDPGGFSTWTYSDNASHINGDYSLLGRADEGDLNVLRDFSIECWVKSHANLSAGAFFHVMGKHSQYQLGRNFTSAPGSGPANFFFTGRLFLDDGSNYLVNGVYPITNEVWYHVGVERFGLAFSVYVNGFLRGSTSVANVDNKGPAAGSGLGTPGLPLNTFSVGGHPFTDVQNNCDVDRPAFYDHALGAARWLAHYEAAKLRLPIRATVSIPVTVSLDTEAITPVDFPFSHNFVGATSGDARPLIERLNYATEVLGSFTDYEQRVDENPYSVERTMIYDVTSTSPNERSRLLNRLWLPGQTYFIPIRSDWTTLVEQADAGQKIVTCETLGRDFDVDSRVILFPKQDPIPTTGYEVGRIAVVNSDGLELAGNLANTWPAQTTIIAPYRKALIPNERLPFKSHAASLQTIPIEFEITRDEVSVNRLTSFVPAQTYLSLEVFRLEKARVDWLDEVDPEMTRRAQTHNPRFGRKYSRSQDSGSPLTFPVRFQADTRASISALLGWLDFRRGKAVPLWVPSHERDFEKLARVSSTQIKVAATDYKTFVDVHDARRHIAFVQDDGSIVARGVTAAVDNGDSTETLTLDNSITLGQFNSTARISYLHYCRLNANEVELVWNRKLNGNEGDMILEVTVTFIELLVVTS